MTQAAPLADAVARGLREDILEGNLKPGTRIRQEAVAGEYGTSRIPVREALRQLQAEGLVTLLPNVGARVAKLEFPELEEIYQLRERLEPFLIAQSAPHLSARQLKTLHQYEAEMQAAADAESVARWIDLDRRFHRASFAGASLPRFLRLVETLWDNTQQYRRVYILLPGRLRIAHLEHQLLLDALTRRDSEDAERFLQTHIRRTRLTLELHPELFDPNQRRAFLHLAATRSSTASATLENQVER